jgi:hypothetical protein
LIEAEQEKVKLYKEEKEKLKENIKVIEQKARKEIEEINSQLLSSFAVIREEIATNVQDQVIVFDSIQKEMKEFRADIAITDNEIILFKSEILVLEETIGRYREMKKKT